MKKSVEVVETQTEKVSRVYCDECGEVLQRTGKDELSGNEIQLNPEVSDGMNTYPFDDFIDVVGNQPSTSGLYGAVYISAEDVAHFCDDCFEHRFGGMSNGAP